MIFFSKIVKAVVKINFKTLDCGTAAVILLIHVIMLRYKTEPFCLTLLPSITHKIGAVGCFDNLNIFVIEKKKET